MRKYSKKIALILVLALTLAVAIPVLATDTVITGRYKEIKLEVVLPSSTTAIINPYGLPVEIKSDSGASLGKVTGNQIVADKPLVGYSLCEVDLDVKATITGEAQGDFRLATAAPLATDTTKSGLVFFEMKAVSDLGYTLTPDANAIGSLDGAKVYNELNTWGKTQYAASNKNQVLVGTRAVTTEDPLCTLKAGTKDANGVVTEPSANGYFVARLNGDVVDTPREEWVATDGVNVTITWIIAPTPTP